jgi:hypothetical protein
VGTVEREARESRTEVAPGRPRRRGPTVRLLFGGVLVLLLGAAATALASEHYAPREESPTATELVADSPLGAAYVEAFVGESGIYDPANGIVTPDEVAFDIEVQAAYDGEDIYLRYEFPTPLPAFYHDYLIYQDGEWVRAGHSPVGPEPHGLYEDRITMLLDDGSVKGFANQGGWLTCHEDLRDPFMYASASDEDVEAHPVLGELYGNDDQRKYIPQSRELGPDWWGQFDGWDAMSPDRVDVYEGRHEAGVFLDLWHWRAHRSNPIGYSDNQFVFEHRNSSPGTGPYRTNWDGDTEQPAFMFDATVTGFDAHDWDEVQAQGYSYDDPFYLAEDVNAVPFDPDRAWQDGDAIPRRLLQTPEGSRGAIKANGQLLPPSEPGGDWTWQVELWRPMDTGEPTADKVLKAGRSYDAAVAVHRLATGSRWHFVTMPFSIGIDVPADVTAERFDGDRPDWDAIEATTLTAMYPGQTSWQRVSERHPGGAAIRDDSMAVLGCHDDEVGLAAAMRANEPRWAGVDTHVEEPMVLAAAVFDPANAVFIFLIIAVGTVVGAVVIARRRRPATPDEEAST